MELDVQIPKLPAFVARMRGAPVVIREEFSTAMHRSVTAGQSLSRRLAPVDRGRLRGSIAPRVWMMGSEVRGAWGTNVAYAEVAEEGRGEGKPMPPPGALLGWMSRHGIPYGRSPTEHSPYYSIEFALARKIGKAGIPGKHFLRQALDTLKPKIEQNFREARTRIIHRLTGGAR